MTTDEQGVDTTTLKDGEWVTLTVTAKVRSRGEAGYTVEYDKGDHDSDDFECIHLEHNHPAATVTRGPTPLPPEPPLGAWVLTGAAIGEVFIRGVAGWSSPRLSPMTWEHLLRGYGPVRLLGDPIEAP